MTLFLFLLKSSVILAILTAAYAWLVKRETFLKVNRWLLWLNVVAVLVLPVLPIPDWQWLPDAPSKAIQLVTKMDGNTPQSEAPQQLTHNSQNNSPQAIEDKQPKTEREKLPQSNPVKYWFSVVYFVGVVVLLGRFLWQLLSLWRLRQRATAQPTDEGVLLVASQEIATPFSFFRWVFFNPSSHTDDEWAQVYAHERVHALDWHSADMVVAECFKIMFWFNPFAWWHQRLVQETLEYVTDHAVLATGVEKKSYQFHLLRSTLNADSQTFTNHFNHSLLKNRIAMMNRQKSSFWALGKYAFFVGMLWLSAAFTKPYREQVVKKIIQQVHELEEVLVTDTTPKVLHKLRDFEWENALNTDSTVRTATNENRSEAGSKYILYTKNSALYWVITPKTTLEDLAVMQKEFDKNGLLLDISQFSMDPLNLFITGVKATAWRKGKGSSCTFNHIDKNGLTMKPLESRGGYITFGQSMGQCATAHKKDLPWTLQEIVQKDEEVAQREAQKNRYEYLMLWLHKSFVIDTVHSFKPNGLIKNNKRKYAQSQFDWATVVSINDDKIKIADAYQGSNFFLDNLPSHLSEIEALQVKNIDLVSFIDAKSNDSLGRSKYILIFTKANP